MRRTRLTAAGAAAVIALGGTIAAAEDPTKADQTVTITVTAAARSITVGDPGGDLSVAAGDEAVSETTTSTLAYNAGDEVGGAKITAEVKAVSPAASENPSLTNNWAERLDELTLGVAASGMANDEGTAATPGAFDKDSVAARDLVTGIAENEVVKDKLITYTLGGNAPSTAVNASVEITFAITDN